MEQLDIDPENLLQDDGNDPVIGEEISEEDASNLIGDKADMTDADLLEFNNKESFSDEESEDKDRAKERPKSSNSKIFAIVREKVGIEKAATPTPDSATSRGAQEGPSKSLGRGSNKNRRRRFRSRNPGSNSSNKDKIVVRPTPTPSQRIFSTAQSKHLKTSNTVNQQVFRSNSVFERLGARTGNSVNEFQDESALQWSPATVNPERPDYIPFRPTSTVNEEVFSNGRDSQGLDTNSPSSKFHQDPDVIRFQDAGPSSSCHPSDRGLSSIKVTFEKSGQKRTHSENIRTTVMEKVSDSCSDEDVMIVKDEIKISIHSTGKSLEQIHYEQSEATLEELRGKRGAVPPNALRGNVHRTPRFKNFEVSKIITSAPKRKRLNRPRLSELTGKVKTLLNNISDDLDSLSLRKLAALHAGGETNVVYFDHAEEERTATIIFATEKAAKSMAYAMSRYIGEDGRQIEAFEPVEL